MTKKIYPAPVRRTGINDKAALLAQQQMTTKLGEKRASERPALTCQASAHANNNNN